MMSPAIRPTLLLAVLAMAGTAALTAACSSTPSQPVAVQTSTLEAQIDDLDRQLLVIHETSGEEQQAQMHQYWNMLQKQLQYVRNLPGVQAHGCSDWTMLDPTVTGQSAFWDSKPCPALHGGAPAAGFPFPDQISPTLFQLMMHQHLDVLSEQVREIVTEQNATARLDLLRQHYETRYRDLQTVLGRDWMWATQKEADLPDSSSEGAVLFAQYCGQCHAPPPPHMNTPAQWGYITERMSHIIEHQAHSGEKGVNLPSTDEFQQIAQYLMAHGWH